MTDDQPPQELIATEIDGAVGRMTLNRPDKANALSREMMVELEERLEQWHEEPAVKVVLLSGAGKGFCAGYDVSQGSSYRSGSSDDDPSTSLSRMTRDYEWLRSKAQRWLAVRDYPKPIIAQIHGFCVAGGFELAMCCDLVVASRDAYFGFPAVRAQGVPPMMLYPWLMSMRDAKEFLWTGDHVSAEQALARGLVNRVFDRESLASDALAYARRVAKTPSEMLLLNKRALHDAYDAMGFQHSVLSGAHFDAIAHGSVAATHFRELVGQDGLRAALSWRDAPYADEA